MDFLLAQHGLHYILDAWIFACHMQISTFEADLGSFSSLLSHEVQDEWIHLICLHLFAFVCISFAAQATSVWVSQVFYRSWRLY
jgi:hypothetical protein